MARLDERLNDARAALTTLDELVDRDRLTLPERDGAILRLVYTFEAIWKAAALLLEETEGLAVRSPKEVIRASRRARLLEDEDAEEALRIAEDRNLTVHMYKRDVGQSIAERLASHTAVLHRWLDALLARAAPSEAYRLFAKAMAERKQVICLYDGYARELCPIILGHSKGEEKALTFQFVGDSSAGISPKGDWRCLFLANVSGVRLRAGRWHSGVKNTRPQGCVEIVDLDVSAKSPRDPKRRLRHNPTGGPRR